MKTRVIGLVLCALFLLGNVSAVAETTGPATVVAKVNETEIFQSDVDFIFDTFVLPRFQLQSQGKELSDEQKTQIEQKIISQLVIQRLLLQAAAKANVSADEELINQQFEAIKAQRQDIPPDKLKQLIQDDLTIQKLIEQEVASKIAVSDEEVQKMYEERKEQFNEPEQVQASHILVEVSPEATQEEKDAARKKIEDVLAQAKAGKDFAELAKEYSSCPSKEMGGDLGFFARGMMVKPFEDAAFALKEGEISDIVETQFGYHIIKLTGKKAQRTIPFEEAKASLTQGVLEQKKNTEINNWINNLRASAMIEIMAPKPKTEETTSGQ
jgi:peptidyl-prolyl cis-trans isomerase C